jgi:hypothetical protein
MESTECGVSDRGLKVLYLLLRAPMLLVDFGIQITDSLQLNLARKVSWQLCGLSWQMESNGSSVSKPSIERAIQQALGADSSVSSFNR